MPQAFLPIFASGVTHVNPNLAYKKENNRIYYFNGQECPLFVHDEDDIATFRLILSQFYVNGLATQAELIKTFGIPSIAMKRAVKKLRTEGVAGFFADNKPKRKPRVLLPEVVEAIQTMLDDGLSVDAIAVQQGIKKDTLQKAIRAGRFKKKDQHFKE